MRHRVILVILGVIQLNYAIIHNLNDDEHARMPAILSVDPFARCLRRPGGRYCTAHVTYVADGNSSLLTLMQEYSAHSSSRFNHTRALIGTCLSERCKDIGENTPDPRILLERCLNRTVWDQYKLRVKVDEKISCNEYGEKKPDIGLADISVATIIIAIVVFNIAGSLFDLNFPKYNGPASQFLQSFSIARNWKILTAPAGGPDTKLESLKGLYGIRAITMINVIVAHTSMSAIKTAGNTKYIEDLYDTDIFYFMLNGTIIMQTFMFLSSFLLMYLGQIFAETHQITWKALPVGILRRWLRVTPAYALVVAFSATWLPRLGTGPSWDHELVAEREACRSGWWRNLLYINNYCEPGCLTHTWYLAADTQLYCLGLVIFVWCRNLSARKIVLATLFIAGLMIPALQTYIQDLDGYMLSTPSSSLDLFVTNRTFNTVYRQSHANVACYVVGLAAGYLVYSLQKNNFHAAKYKAWRPLYWALVPLGFYMTVACKVFYSSPRPAAAHRAAAAALVKPVYVLMLASFIIGMIFKIENTYRGILEWRGWVTLSRVSYSAYLVHGAYLFLTYSTFDHPIHISYLRLNEMVLFATTMIYSAAYLFWLTVEAPLTQLTKCCLETRPAKEKKQRCE